MVITHLESFPYPQALKNIVYRKSCERSTFNGINFCQLSPFGKLWDIYSD